MRSHKLMHQLCRVYALSLSRDTEAYFFFEGQNDCEGHGYSPYQFTLTSTGASPLEKPLQFLVTTKRDENQFSCQATSYGSNLDPAFRTQAQALTPWVAYVLQAIVERPARSGFNQV